jgi:hypothetical protein
MPEHALRLVTVTCLYSAMSVVLLIGAALLNPKSLPIFPFLSFHHIFHPLHAER